MYENKAEKKAHMIGKHFGLLPTLVVYTMRLTKSISFAKVYKLQKFEFRTFADSRVGET